MSEFTNIHTKRSDIRWQLLATVSAATLSICAAPQAASAQDQDRPTVWVELGGQLERTNTSIEPFAPKFILENLGAPHNFTSPLEPERFPRSSFGGEGSITFQPHGSDWAFTAVIRYGRSNNKKHLHQQTSTQIARTFFPGAPVKYQPITRWNDTATVNRETHTILDFRAGRDLGLGLMGHASTSNIEFGVRYAQFSSKANTVFHSLPDQYFPKNFINFHIHHHSYYARQDLTHSFRGVGPSVAWNGSASLAGKAETSELSFDWGANASVLFGRQKVAGTHQSTGIFYSGVYNATAHSQYHNNVPMNRSHSVVVPNVGGLAGLSFRHGDAKVSFGYRADFFFGAVDGGINARKSHDRNFYGPYATISIGLGG